MIEDIPEFSHMTTAFRFSHHFFSRYQSFSPFNIKMLQYLYYMTSCALDDDETQVKGMVLVVVKNTENSNNWFTDPFSPTSWLMDPFWSKAWREIRNAFTYQQLHYCVVASEKKYSMKVSEEGPNTEIRTHQGKERDD